MAYILIEQKISVKLVKRSIGSCLSYRESYHPLFFYQTGIYMWKGSGFSGGRKTEKKTWMINVHACLAKFLLKTTVFYSYFLQLFLFKINWIIILFCSMNYTSGLSVWCTNFQRYVSKLISKMCWWKWCFL